MIICFIYSTAQFQLHVCINTHVNSSCLHVLAEFLLCKLNLHTVYIFVHLAMHVQALCSSVTVY